MDLQTLIESWNGFAVVTHFDAPTGTWIFIALHDRTLGRPTGGTRIRRYESPAEGLNDAMHLATGMTHKWAAADLPYGGGKAVLAVPGPIQGEARESLLHRYGELVESLKGGFATGEDLGTTPRDMATIAETTQYVIGASQGQMTDPGPFTARGVFAALRSAVRAAYGDDELTGRPILVQGLGDVGAPLARHLVDAGARVLLSDTDEQRQDKLAAELGSEGEESADGRLEIVPPAEVYDTPCDVFAPCAVGFVLSDQTIPRLQCRVVTGSANNQLASPEAADLLHQRGILYAPDYIANGGGAIAFGMMEQGVDDREILFARIDKIGDALDEIFEEAADRDESPVRAALRRVERILEREGNG